MSAKVIIGIGLYYRRADRSSPEEQKVKTPRGGIRKKMPPHLQKETLWKRQEKSEITP